jgi:hypothetical protein
MRRTLVCLVACVVLAAAHPARGEDAHELAKKLNNPISDLVSVPLQFNWEFGHGPDEDMWQITNLQPVVPFAITPNTNMIARLIMPTISTPGQTIDGDMVFSLFFSPSRSSGVVWGVGPVLQLPRSGPKWGVGPTAVLLKMSGGRTYGALVNHLWSVAGDDDAPDLNQTFIQPFFAYTTSKAVTFSIQSESTANWEAPSGEEWTIPLIFQVSKVSKFGPFPASYGAGPGFYLESPGGGPEWRIRSFVTLLLPAK